MQRFPTSSSDTDRIRTLVVCDQPMILAELRNFLGLWPDIYLLGKASDSSCSASGLVEKLKPNVLLLDGTDSGRETLAHLVALKARHPQVPVILLASQDSRTYALQAISSGASGYVLSMSGEVNIVQAIREIHAGHLYFCPRIRRLFSCLGHRTSLPAVAASECSTQGGGRKTLPLNKGKTA